MKKVLLSLLMVFAVFTVTACSTKTEEAQDLYFYNADYSAISEWGSMVTPGGGEGSVTAGDGFAIVKAAEDGWGGVQSEPITFDLSKNPMLMIQIKESADGNQWGVKIVPTNPAVDEHEWGIYLLEDNNFKHNNYAVADIRAKLGEDFIDVYGETFEAVVWVYATGGPESTVEVAQLKMFNEK